MNLKVGDKFQITNKDFPEPWRSYWYEVTEKHSKGFSVKIVVDRWLKSVTIVG